MDTKVKEVTGMLGTRIAALRRESNMSQAQLAQRLQISASAVGMYEQGRREPSADLLVELARVFGVTTDYLLTGQSACPEQEDSLSELLLERLEKADHHLKNRKDRCFSRQELAVLFAALLMEP